MKEITLGLFLLICVSTLFAQEVPSEKDIYIVLSSTDAKFFNQGILKSEYTNSKDGYYTKTFRFQDDNRNIHEQLVHFKDKGDHINNMEVTKVLSTKLRAGINLDYYYPKWTRETAKAFFYKLRGKRVWVMDRNDLRNNRDFVIATETMVLVGGRK